MDGKTKQNKGAGKTSFVKALAYSMKKPPYIVNLDPACHETSYPCNIDIRDTVNYKEVMKQYSLGYFQLIAPHSTHLSNQLRMQPLIVVVVVGGVVVSRTERSYNHVAQSVRDEIRASARYNRQAFGPVRLRAVRHAGPDRGLHLVGLGRHHHRGTCMIHMFYCCCCLLLYVHILIHESIRRRPHFPPSSST